MSNDTPIVASVDNGDNNKFIMDALRQIQERLDRMDSANSVLQHGKVVFKNNRATILKLYDELVEEYPAVYSPDFYVKELEKDHELFDWEDFHQTEYMEYEPPAVLEHGEVRLPDHSRKAELMAIGAQKDIAKFTRMWDTHAHETIQSGDNRTPYGRKTLALLNTSRIYAGHLAAKWSRFREGLYYEVLGIKQGQPRDRFIKTVAEVAELKAHTETIRKAYKLPEKPKDKKSDGKGKKGKPGSSDKPKDQHKKQSGNGSDYKSDRSKLQQKSDNKSRNKSRDRSHSKSRDRQGGKYTEAGNESEKSD